MAHSTGIVYLVGAGPGDAAYLTLQAAELLRSAEVLVYDALVNLQLLDQAPENCLMFDVGKRGGQPGMAQPEINHLLVEQCLQGRRIVRLKSGDPFIFGRAMAEIEALREAGCEFEVIPGLSSALTAPLLAGIPLTDAALSRCFAVLSAHEPNALSWEALAQLETLVILMGAQRLPEILTRLQQQGVSPNTPICIIRWAGHSQEQIWVGELIDILEKTQGINLSPAVIVIGEVVKLRAYIQPAYSRGVRAVTDTFKATSNFRSEVPGSVPPLTGKTILVTRAVSQSSQFGDRLRRRGATVIEMPALEVCPPSSWEPLDQAISCLDSFDWLILTSTNAVDYFFERLGTQLTDIRALAAVKIAVVGEKTAQSLKQRGLQPDFVPPNFMADFLIAHFPDRDLQGKRFLFPRVESGGRDLLAKEFVAKGAEVVEVPAYETRCPEIMSPEALEALRNRQIDVITFASSKTVRNFCQLLEASFGTDWQTYLASRCIASIGPQTSKACQTAFGRVDVEAQEYTLEGLAQAIVQWSIGTVSGS